LGIFPHQKVLPDFGMKSAFGDRHDLLISTPPSPSTSSNNLRKYWTSRHL